MSGSKLFLPLAAFVVSRMCVIIATHEQCGKESSLYGKMLKGHIFKTIENINSFDCLQECNSDVKCRSLNYVMSKERCELNDRTKEDKAEDFVANSDRFYMRRSAERVPLGSIPELPAESCQEIKASEGNDTVSGSYWLDSPTSPGTARFVHCNMITAECDDPFGMETGAIPDNQITASSEYLINHAAIQGRLNFQADGSRHGCWSAGFNNQDQWLQVDLGSVRTVTTIATQGRNGHSQWVTSYKLQYSSDGSSFQYYREQGDSSDKVFDGNTDRDSIVHHNLNSNINARYIRVRPMTWQSHISMRMELYGC